MSEKQENIVGVLNLNIAEIDEHSVSAQLTVENGIDPLTVLPKTYNDKEIIWGEAMRTKNPGKLEKVDGFDQVVKKGASYEVIGHYKK